MLMMESTNGDKEEMSSNTKNVHLREADTEANDNDVSGAAVKVLSNQLITRIIFQFLPMKDLFSVSQVSQLWRQISLNVRKDKDRFCSVASLWQEPETELNYYDDFPPFKTPQHDSFKVDLLNELSQIRCKPKVALFFGTVDGVFAEEDRDVDDIPKLWTVNKEDIINNLPAGCQVIGTSSKGIVGLDDDGDVMELENNEDEYEAEVLFKFNSCDDYQGQFLERSLIPAVSYMLVPEKPGSKVIPFHLLEKDLDEMIKDIKDVNEGKRMKEADIQDKLLSKVLPELEDCDKIKAVILLSNGLDLPLTMHFLQAVSRREQDKVAIGGVVGGFSWSSVHQTTMIDMFKELNRHVGGGEPGYMQSSGIVIAGDNVQAASVLLTRKIKKEVAVRQELKKLKNCKMNEENSFALMFACCGRGEGLYGKDNVEASVFQQMFPDTPIAGIFGNGEIGAHYLPDFVNIDNDSTAQGDVKDGSFKSKLKVRDYQHSYSTIFVMVSFGNV